MSERAVTSRTIDVQRRRGVVREVRLGDGMLRINNDSEFVRSVVRVGQDHLHRVRREAPAAIAASDSLGCVGVKLAAQSTL